MSNNYYLHRDGHPCETCGTERRESIVHIGLSALGWVFLWRGWRTPEESPFSASVTTPAVWEILLREEVSHGAVIKDEYGIEKSLDDFLAFVRGKRQRVTGSPARRHSDVTPRGDCAHIDGDDIAFYEFS